MAIADRIPQLSDKELETLNANALRLGGAGSANERRQAEELLPLIGAELQARRLARLAAQSAKRRATAKRKLAA